ncbi:hypothetical protein LSH36_1768g00016 [Paralvinella palmiformis]|uniref:Uncharacterized protein n=1 Tax=Paralvinella palmiformis TaxID=53620 RepID=A0AAD9ISJ1_9ANNE|nr:hypothetical protein LSH36_1768g00016 [Paralvinella palmiformis]
MDIRQINYDCAACDSYAERQDRVGCRLWCNIDVAEADDIWLAEEMDNAWTNTWGCADECTEAAYQQWWAVTTSENQMNGVFWAWVLKKAWKIDMKILRKKEFDREKCRV